MTFTEANMETAMCLWEAVQDGLRTETQDALCVALIEESGTAEARHTVISWVPECEAEWEAAREAGTEAVPYDWEHCPAFLARKLAERFADLVGAA